MIDTMIRKIAITAFLLVILCSATVGTNSAQALLAGVTQGNEFTYEIMGLWQSVVGATIPEDVLQLNNTDYYKVTVTNVVDANVAVHTIWRFKNGTRVEGDSEVDLETGIFTGGFWAIFAPDLNTSDLIHPSGPDQITVNETITRNYLNDGRDTNYVITSIWQPDPSDPTSSTYYTQKTEVYFDKQTGMLVELRDEATYNNPSRTVTIIWEITDSNVWTVPEFPSVLIMPLLMIATLLIVIAIKKIPEHHKYAVSNK